MATAASENLMSNWLIDVELSLSSIYDASVVNAFLQYLQVQAFEDDKDAVIEDIKNGIHDSFIAEHMAGVFNETDKDDEPDKNHIKIAYYHPQTTKFVQELRHIISKHNNGNGPQLNMYINVDKRPSNTSINTIATSTINSVKSRSTLYSTQTHQSTTTTSINTPTTQIQIVPGENEYNLSQHRGASMHKTESIDSMSDDSYDLDQDMLTDILNECDDFKSELPISFDTKERDPYATRGNAIIDPAYHYNDISSIDHNGKSCIKPMGSVSHINVNDTKEIDTFIQEDEVELDPVATDDSYVDIFPLLFHPYPCTLQ